MSEIKVPARFVAVAAVCAAKERKIGDETVMAVDGEDLHRGLGVKTPYHIWRSRRVTALSRLGFRQGLDWQAFSPDGQPIEIPTEQNCSVNKTKGYKEARTYLFALDMSRHLGLLEKTEQGHLVREYYLWLERAMIAQQQNAARRMTPDDVRAMIREEIAAGGKEIVRLIKGAAWGMVSGQGVKADRHFNRVHEDSAAIFSEVSDGFREVHDDIAETRLISAKQLLADQHVPSIPGFVTRISNKLRIFCVDNSRRHRRSPETKVYFYDLTAARDWLRAEGQAIIDAKMVGKKAEEKVARKAAEDACRGQGNLNLVELRPKKPAS